MKRKEQWSGRSGKRTRRRRNDYKDYRFGRNNDGDAWGHRRPLQGYAEYNDGKRGYNGGHDVPLWNRERFQVAQPNQGWPVDQSWLTEVGGSSKHAWGYGKAPGYGGGYGGFPVAAGYGAGYGGFVPDQEKPLVEVESPPVSNGPCELAGEAPINRRPSSASPYELMSWNDLNGRKTAGQADLTVRCMEPPVKAELCWDFNTKGGCKRPNCLWRHEPDVPEPETQEDQLKRDDEMLQYFQKIDKVTQAHQAVAPPPTKPDVPDEPQSSHLLDEPMDVINNDTANNEPVINEPVNNKPIVAPYEQPPIAQKFQSTVPEKFASKAPRIIRAPANVVTIAPANADIAPPMVAPDLAPDKEECLQDTDERSAAKEELKCPEQKKNQALKNSSASKPITKGKCCLLCRRRFKSIEMLKKHLRESKLHQKNLKLKGFDQGMKNAAMLGGEGSVCKAYS